MSISIIEKLDSKTLLEWKYVSEKFPWNVLFLLGAGFALATACKVLYVLEFCINLCNCVYLNKKINTNLPVPIQFWQELIFADSKKFQRILNVWME